MTTDDPIARWVKRVNDLARRMDDAAASMHPSAWGEQMAPLNERYRKLAASGPHSKHRRETSCHSSHSGSAR